jgi:glycosyltransferase involved in cell wall biosynthesis
VVLAIDGVVREVVEDADCGIFAAPGNAKELADAIRKLATNMEQSRAMGLKGHEYLKEHFSRASIGNKLVGLLEELISSY